MQIYDEVYEHDVIIKKHERWFYTFKGRLLNIITVATGQIIKLWTFTTQLKHAFKNDRNEQNNFFAENEPNVDVLIAQINSKVGLSCIYEIVIRSHLSIKSWAYEDINI